MQHFKYYTKEDILSLTNTRKYETRIGERVQVVQSQDEIKTAIAQSTAPYVLFGIPENIGTQANKGSGGADALWLPFLQQFLNLQSNDFFDGNEVLVLGHFDFGSIQYVIDTTAKTDEEKMLAFRHAVISIDDAVEEMVKHVIAAGKFPLVVGGGHNSTYPLIKGSAKSLHKLGHIPLAQINCISLDGDANYNPLEGRHSGNAIRYAEEDGYLQKYCVIALQENFLPQNQWIDIVNNPFFDCITFEDIFIHEKRSFKQAVAHAVEFSEGAYSGIDLDLSIIQNGPATSDFFEGVSVTNARQYAVYTASFAKPAYFFICCGAGNLFDNKHDITFGGVIASLITDFIKAHKE